LNGGLDGLGVYLQHVRRQEPLDIPAELDLIRQINAATLAVKQSMEAACPRDADLLTETLRAGAEAKATLIQAHLPLAVSIAKQYQRAGIELDDLIQDATMGLYQAVDRFESGRGFRFSTYAMWWVRHAVTRGVANTGRTIRLPVHTGRMVAKLRRTRRRLEIKLGRPATLSELSAELELWEDDVVELLSL
jgi:RNA polymerase sigma factor (sigma-70 family)